MADEKPKPRPNRMKRRRAPLRDEHVRCIVAIERWDWSYSFGLDSRKDTLNPHMEHRHLKITRKLLRPVNPKVTTVELHLLPRSELDEDRRCDDLRNKKIRWLRYQAPRVCCRHMRHSSLAYPIFLVKQNRFKNRFNCVFSSGDFW